MSEMVDDLPSSARIIEMMGYQTELAAYQFQALELLCQSALEERMAAALLAYNYWKGDILKIAGLGSHVRFRAIVPQFYVSDLRFDFLVCDPIDYRICVGVECDGEMWHSGDEAINRDRRRDIFVKELGFEVCRCSGNAIFKNPINEAHKVFQALSERWRKPKPDQKWFQKIADWKRQHQMDAVDD